MLATRDAIWRVRGRQEHSLLLAVDIRRDNRGDQVHRCGGTRRVANASRDASLPALAAARLPLAETGGISSPLRRALAQLSRAATRLGGCRLGDPFGDKFQRVDKLPVGVGELLDQ